MRETFQKIVGYPCSSVPKGVKDNMKQISMIHWLIIIIVFIVVAGRLLLHFSPTFRMEAHRFRSKIAKQPFYPIGSKYWAHQCNDLRMLEEMIHIYPGIELDIRFHLVGESGIFDMTHNPRPTTENPLENAFVLLSPPKKVHIWLDFKNLDEKNAGPALRELDRLVDVYQINKERLIIESPDYVRLGLFHQHGYYTSFYCPTDEKRYLRETSHQQEYAKIVNEAVNSGNVDAISFQEQYYPLIKALNVNVEFLTWYGSEKWRFFFFKKPDEEKQTRRRLIENDPQVKVILVNPPSRYES